MKNLDCQTKRDYQNGLKPYENKTFEGLYDRAKELLLKYQWKYDDLPNKISTDGIKLYKKIEYYKRYFHKIQVMYFHSYGYTSNYLRDKLPNGYHRRRWNPNGDRCLRTA